MEVILIKDLKRKGTFGDVVKVANGYAINYLIPNGFAISATKSNKKRFEEMKAKAFESVQERRQSLTQTAELVKGKTFTIVALSRDGKLYGSITPSLIVEAIQKDIEEISINAGDILIEDGQIKFVGTYQCKVQLTRDISSRFTLIVEADETDEQPELLESILDDDPVIDQNIDADESTEEIHEVSDSNEESDEVNPSESSEVVSEATSDDEVDANTNETITQ